MLAKNTSEDKPPGNVDATINHEVIPVIIPPMAPDIIPGPVKRPQNMLNEIGTTADPIMIPMNK